MNFPFEERKREEGKSRISEKSKKYENHKIVVRLYWTAVELKLLNLFFLFLQTSSNAVHVPHCRTRGWIENVLINVVWISSHVKNSSQSCSSSSREKILKGKGLDRSVLSFNRFKMWDLSVWLRERDRELDQKTNILGPRDNERLSFEKFWLRFSKLMWLVRDRFGLSVRQLDKQETCFGKEENGQLSNYLFSSHALILEGPFISFERKLCRIRVNHEHILQASTNQQLNQVNLLVTSILSTNMNETRHDWEGMKTTTGDEDEVELKFHCAALFFFFFQAFSLTHYRTLRTVTYHHSPIHLLSSISSTHRRDKITHKSLSTT